MKNAVKKTGERWLRGAALFALLAAAGCPRSNSGPTTHACLPTLSPSCRPLYDPSFDAIFKNTFGPSCGSSITGSSCHSEKGGMGGLILQTADEAYAHLLGQGGARRRVIPGNPECSMLMEKVASDDPSFRMPPGDQKLSQAERCSIQLWIAEGAKR